MSDHPEAPEAGAWYLGHRVLVRPLGADDLIPLYARPEVRRVHHAYRPWQGCADADLPAMRERLVWLGSLQPALEIEGLVLHRPSGTPLGLLCLSGIDPINGKAELSAAFFRGAGSRPALEAMHWAFEAVFSGQSALTLRKLLFHVLPGNEAAIRLLHRLGIPLEARLREELLLPGGECVDLLRYAVLRREWLEGEARAALARLVPLRRPDGDARHA